MSTADFLTVEDVQAQLLVFREVVGATKLALLEGDLFKRLKRTYTTTGLVEVEGSPWRILFLQLDDMVFEELQSSS